MKTLSKSKGVKDIAHRRYCAMSGLRCLVYHPNGICPDVRDCEACKQDNVNEMPPTILDDDIPDWEHDHYSYTMKPKKVK